MISEKQPATGLTDSRKVKPDTWPDTSLLPQSKIESLRQQTVSDLEKMNKLRQTIKKSQE
jgi:hypothetical protein